MKPSLKFAFVVSLAVAVLAMTSCYPAHSGSSGGGLNGGGGGGNGGGGGGPFTIGGNVIGLQGTGLVLEDNGGDDLPVNANGKFTFKTALSGAYAVVVKTQPSAPTQSCSVANGTGSATGNVTNILVNCGTSGLTIGGTVSGLIGSGLVLQNNGADNLAVNGSGNVPFTFPVPVTAGSAYAVTILAQPKNPPQVCTVVNGSGTANSNIATVQVICTQPGFSIGGSVVGLVEATGDTLELQDNAGDNLLVTGDTVFTFPTKITNGGIYNVNVFLPPNSQPQPCNIFGYTGIASGNVTDIIVDCQHNDWNWVTWYISKTNSANNYASISTPLFPPNDIPRVNLGTPGGRDFAASWTDNSGRRWLFGGLGFPYPAPLFKQLPGFLNDLWVYDKFVGGWVPANEPVVFPANSLYWVVDPTPLEFEDVPTGVNPGSRWGSSSWTDGAGTLWLFGGQGFGSTPNQLDPVLLNDMWKCTPGASIDPKGAGTSSCPWVFVRGSTAGNQAGTYGAKGVASASNIPGGRWAAATQKDASGNVWLFGGQGEDSAGTIGLLNDLWKYNTASGQWTWVAGSNLKNVNGAYGTKGVASAANAPGARQAGVLWTDTAGNVWLFGGFGLDSAGTVGSTPPGAGLASEGAILNDLWEFNVTSQQWIWVSGSNLANQTGAYTTQATNNLFTGDASSVPGSRWGSVGFSDAFSNLWLIGGWGYGTTTTDPTGFLNDIWEYQHSSGQWIWWKGNSNANQNGVYLAQGVDFPGIPFVNNWAGARRGAAIWAQDPNGYVFVFGGEGVDASQGSPPGYLNDLWTYLPFPN